MRVKSSPLLRRDENEAGYDNEAAVGGDDARHAIGSCCMGRLQHEHQFAICRAILHRSTIQMILT